MVRRPTFGGLAGALLLWWRSLYPTLMPRSWVAQAAISALCLSIGYAIGTLLDYAVRRALVSAGHEVPPKVAKRAGPVLGVLAGVVVLLGAVAWPRWQNEQRALVSLEDIAPSTVVPVLVLTVVLAVILLAIGRLVGGAVRRVDRFNHRHLPRPLAAPATIVLVLVVGSFLLRNVAFEQFTAWANSAFGTVDDTTADGTVRPGSRYVSGGRGSLAAWDTLGYQGREFVAGATTTKELREFHGDDADVTPPIRVYAGLRSASSPEGQAVLAERELERTGAFEREVLVVATATGTGWIDPDASEAIEQLYAGDSAIVSMQYSFLPSWISSITDKDKAAKASALLYDQVYRHWADLPKAERPKLVVFGLSLGSFGAESAFAGVDGHTSIANIVSRSDGALLVGPTHGNPIHQQLLAERDPGSPAWRPVIDRGRTVRFVNRGPQGRRLPEPWTAPRVLYIQHPSDPVTFWSLDSLWSSPEWMDHPRGYDVPDQGRWFPIVTGVQGVFDLMAGFGAPPGYGHDYRLDYVDGWAQVASPRGWTDADSRELEQFLFPS